MKNLILLLILSSFVLGEGQTLKIFGTVKTGAGEELSFANIRVAGTPQGTSANVEGVFELLLPRGQYNLIASYIGFRSDTITVDLKGNMELEFVLQETGVRLGEVTVLPGENPAIAIMKKAVEYREKRDEQIESYIFDAFTKAAIKTTEDITSGDRSLSVGVGVDPDKELLISGILENESRGYFEKPNSYKEEIIARKQSANFPPSVNLLTGNRLVQNFYTDDLRFFGKPMFGPLSDEATDYYYFRIEDTLAQDNSNIFKIFMTPDDETDPGFVGHVYIEDGSFSMLKVDVTLNTAANPGGIFTDIRVFQQYSKFENNIYMPVDYRLFAEGNFLSIFKFGFEINSILYDYDINAGIEDDFFDMAVITVLPGADDKDSLYWTERMTIPNTLEEAKAYKRIDSLESLPVSFWDNVSLLSTSIPFTKHFEMSAPLAMYHFNKVEGNSVDLGFYLNDALGKRLNAETEFNYGFADKRFKKSFSGYYLMGDYRTTRIDFEAYDKLATLFSETDYYNPFTSTLLSLFGKYDFRDYYYTSGYELSFTSEIFPVLEIGAGWISKTDRIGYNRSDFSFFNRDKEYDINRPVNQLRTNAASASFKLDFRKFIEDGYYRRRVSPHAFWAVLDGSYTISDDNLGSEINYKKYKLGLEGKINLFRTTDLNFLVKGLYSDGPAPFQDLYALPGNISGGAKNDSYRTLKYARVYGDQVLSVFLDYNLHSTLFNILNVPFLKEEQLRMSVHFNAAWCNISGESLAIIPVDYQLFTTPFYETGFSISHPLIPFEFEFTWKLTHKDDDNFRFGLNTFAF